MAAKKNTARQTSAATTKQNTNAGDNSSKEQQQPQGSFLQQFFSDQLQDIYYAEKQLLKALPELKEAATSEELEDAFEDHTRQTERHVKRLEKVFRMIKMEPAEKKCEAMDGLINEARKIISDTETGSMTRDAALIIAAQKVEHYEIASYGGLAQLAVTMQMDQAAELLEKTLEEEEETDHMLTEIAEGYINVEAENEGGYQWDDKNNNQQKMQGMTAAAF